MRKIDLPMAEIVTRYTEDGENASLLGRAYGASQRTILRRLHEAGVELRTGGFPFGHRYALGNKSARKRGGPLREMRGYLTTCDREGDYVRIHRGCWEAYYGPIPRKHIIHHVNSDRLDNRIENLACMTQGEHMHLHATNRRQP